MYEPLVSVVIPFYSRVDWLIEATESVLAQTYKNIEIIIVNDGSPEKISEFLERYSSKITYVYQENKGAAAARNVGIKLSKGEYIAFLDADDVWMPNKLELQISMMIEKNSWWSHTNYVTFGLGKKEKIIDVSNFNGDIFPLCIISSPIATPSVVMRKCIFIDNPNIRFDETMKYGEDSMLWLQVSIKYKLLAIHQPLVKVRIRGSNSALMAYSQIKARADIWDKIKTDKIFNCKIKLSIFIKIAFCYCSVLYKLLNNLENKLDENFIEIISKFLYVFPWIIFKIEKKYLLNNRNR
ncbi:glycosyl transferase family 2 [Thermoanaerobacterium xylanolyticum LX-11]|uniref:Glycosyl transferase family 2 n=1 Tax=Thermoanaerobacterium xylanolyticum (strain ATCC 49914 / DSM 7097 / LX-11) TaxID=858215 RepID=F6BIT7_THEXL|nr:glycosyltransferase family 2 protein [Thermoanaerobacterium xylanolyticum]AEF17822.1 glycosyl transferase family 2 [Thermoanaerobacterium xylanolyticum LX-11]